MEHALVHSDFLGRSLLCVEYILRIEIPHFVLSLCDFLLHRISFPTPNILGYEWEVLVVGKTFSCIVCSGHIVRVSSVTHTGTFFCEKFCKDLFLANQLCQI